ncbi:hypothetical protein C0J52_15864 [Blattella germanica]|nr:hypothetical protein C0J52_15864 [Blattella germanica]
MSFLAIAGQLESFSLVRMCTDSILTSACQHCMRLRSVDVSGSAHVTDLSVSSLLALRHLTHLDVFGTGVTAEGLARLVQGLPSTLKALGCTHAHLGQVEASFPMLTSLRAGLDCVDGTLPWFGNMADLLGHRLLKLELHGCKGVDVGVVAHNCCALESFVMSSCSYSPRLHQTIRRNVLGFQRLKRLTLDKSSKFPAYPNIDKLVLECALCSAHEIQVVRVESYAHFTRQFFERLLATNDMRHLRELFLFATYSDVMDLSTLTFLLMRCRSLDLVSLRGLAVPGVETFQKWIKHDFPEVELSIEVMEPCGF